MDYLVLGIGGAVALQVLQTIQIAIVGRRVDTVAKTLHPPPMRETAAGVSPPRCTVCGLPFNATELDAGVCIDCSVTPATRQRGNAAT
jgi:predicted Zn-ribbon and HTH transcriptional regulator